MTINPEDMINSIMESLSRIDYIKPQDIPGIELYMDQVTTFMNSRLASSRRKEDDKLLTKTMINNYAKNRLLPPPVKKKYSKEHMLLLIFIYYFKNILSITDIQALLNPLTEKYFQDNPELTIEEIYSEVFRMEKAQVDILKEAVQDNYLRSRETFQDAPQEDRDFLQMFSFICLLSFDVYMKKQLIEKLVDTLDPPGKK